MSFSDSLVIAGFDDIVGHFLSQNILLTPTTKNELAALMTPTVHGSNNNSAIPTTSSFALSKSATGMNSNPYSIVQSTSNSSIPSANATTANPTTTQGATSSSSVASNVNLANSSASQASGHSPIVKRSSISEPAVVPIGVNVMNVNVIRWK
jgi:hypothetical protein